MTPYLDYLFIVCNFIPEKKDRIFLEDNCGQVLIRDNKGFDGGAVKDAISMLFLGKIGVSIDDFDELVIVNDTFYGFFYPIQPFFDWFRDSDNDFAGFIKNDGGYVWMERNIPAHVQGYFITVKKRMFLDDSFKGYWEKLGYPQTTTDNIFDFEYGFSEFFSSKGFKFDGFYDLKKHELTRSGDVDYMDHPYELMKYEKFPIFKYKAGWIDYLDDSSYKALAWIREESHDAFEEIIKHVEKSSNRMYFNQNDLNNFCKGKQGLYIYGHGILGRRVYNFLKLMDYNFKGYVVTSVLDDDEDRVLSITDVDLGQNEGLIVGMNKTNTLEIRNYLDSRFDSGIIFYPCLN